MPYFIGICSELFISSLQRVCRDYSETKCKQKLWILYKSSTFNYCQQVSFTR